MPVHILLAMPSSFLFGLLVGLRRALYRLGILRTERLPVPVIVVGNLSVGGAGKTPLTLTLVEWLRTAGFAPGIISRGYGGKARLPMPVTALSDPALVGDEPVLLARRAACPVWIGRNRPDAGRNLLSAHPEVDVLIADDGLQHLALARDIELVVVDAARGFGNGWLLPAGPLREPLSRLARVDAIVINGREATPLPPAPPHFRMHIAGSRFINLAQTEHEVAAAHFASEQASGALHAIAGIGHPERFFRQLASLGLDATPHAFPDHHAYVASDLPAGCVLMTEKDAVKCAPLGKQSARSDLWFLAVDADVEGGLQPLIITLLNARKRSSHGSQTA
jgi:tetraacyldisaccharide 4'-kinase